MNLQYQWIFFGFIEACGQGQPIMNSSTFVALKPELQEGGPVEPGYTISVKCAQIRVAAVRPFYPDDFGGYG